jgi:hypothetical protein
MPNQKPNRYQAIYRTLGIWLGMEIPLELPGSTLNPTYTSKNMSHLLFWAGVTCAGRNAVQDGFA